MGAITIIKIIGYVLIIVADGGGPMGWANTGAKRMERAAPFPAGGGDVWCPSSTAED